MDGVGTSIVGRPRRLSADRRARPTYTLIWEEPRWLSADVVEAVVRVHGGVKFYRGAAKALLVTP